MLHVSARELVVDRIYSTISKRGKIMVLFGTKRYQYAYTKNVYPSVCNQYTSASTTVKMGINQTRFYL